MNNFKKGINEKDFIDPMIVDTDETMAEKKKTWEMIFLVCPEQADLLIKAYNENGPEAFSKAKITIAYENTSETPA